MKSLQLVEYTAAHASEWDNVIARSLNGTFLLNRSYMDYHSDRFHDCSLLIYIGVHVQAVFPACWGEDSATGTRGIDSHRGLTYGGLIVTEKMTGADVVDTYRLLAAYYHSKGAQWLRVKPVPFVYHRQPIEEEQYALFLLGARMESRALSSTISLANPLPFIADRRRAVRKAERADILVRESHESADITAFHALLDHVLTSRHQTHPVHSTAEIQLLMSRFPNEIRLFLATNPEGQLLAGSWVFDCGRCVHTQYMAVSEQGRQCGALDLIISHLVHDVFVDRQYFDFGISTENGGHLLNRSLLFQKEGFGGRGICYDSYVVDLQ